jgi:hypothetical protein
MDDLKLIVSPSPHIRDKDTTEKMMFAVLTALLPVLAASIYFFRWDAVRLVLLSAGAAIATEAIFQRLRKQPIRVADGSALVTGVLLGLIVPPSLPSWMVILGAVFAIAIGKQVFGGLGQNPFNPALVGRAILSVSFAAAMTKWTAPFDAVTAATPLFRGTAHIPDLFFGTVAGSLGENLGTGNSAWRNLPVLQGLLRLPHSCRHFCFCGSDRPAGRSKCSFPPPRRQFAFRCDLHGHRSRHHTDYQVRTLDFRHRRRIDCYADSHLGKLSRGRYFRDFADECGYPFD